MFRLVTIILLCVGTASLGAGPGSAAQAVCGDATGDNTVTVTDGVQVLRAAAGLSTACSTTPAICDVDGSGSITVTDGVNVLRLAANLSVSTACTAVDEDVQAVVDSLVPFLMIGLSDLAKATSSAQNTAVLAAKTGACPFGGAINSDKTELDSRLTLNACIEGRSEIGNFQLDGTIDIVFVSGTATFDLSFEELSSGRIVRFSGAIPGRLRSGGGLIVNGGPLLVTTQEGNFDLMFDALELDAAGNIVSGSCRADDDDDSALTSVSIVVTSTIAANVHAVFDDDRTANAVLNLETGDLTSAP
jgi:hypothetical protein